MNFPKCEYCSTDMIHNSNCAEPVAQTWWECPNMPHCRADKAKDLATELIKLGTEPTNSREGGYLVLAKKYLPVAEWAMDLESTVKDLENALQQKHDAEDYL